MDQSGQSRCITCSNLGDQDCSPQFNPLRSIPEVVYDPLDQNRSVTRLNIGGQRITCYCIPCDNNAQRCCYVRSIIVANLKQFRDLLNQNLSGAALYTADGTNAICATPKGFRVVLQQLERDNAEPHVASQTWRRSDSTIYRWSYLKWSTAPTIVEQERD